MALRTPFFVAHRGASDEAPENTLAAFRLAWQQGVAAVEGDFYLTRDGAVVCLHDASTQRTGDLPLVVAEATLADLRQVDVGAWKGPQWAGERLPTLGEVLATAPPGGRFFLELKGGPAMVAPVAAELRRAGLPAAHTAIIAFDAATIAAAKRELPACPAYWLVGFTTAAATGQLSPSPAEVLARVQDLGADGVDASAHPLLTAATVAAFHAAGYAFHVWTVDDPVLAAHYWSLGVDSITSNRAAWLARAAG